MSIGQGNKIIAKGGHDSLVDDVKVNGISVLTNKVANIDLTVKQDNLIAGTNISIASDGKTISANNTTYSAGNGLTLSGTTFSANVVNNLTSTSTTNALSANAGKSLQEQINNLNTRGKYLSVWDCTTGLAMDEPPVNPYIIETGSYFIVGVVGTGTNYRPNGGTYDKDVPSTTVETNTVKVNDTYYYDGTTWRLLATPEISVAFSTLAGNPNDNVNLKNVLDNKASDSSVIHTTGDETATGVKTLSLGNSTAITQGTSSNSTNIATTAYVNNKFQLVSSLPTNPDSNVWYAIAE